MDDLIRLLAKQANDYDSADSRFQFVRYDEDILRWYISLAYSTIAASNKSEFTEVKTVTLDSGCWHYVCDECQELVDVISVGGDTCDTPTKITDRGKKLSSMFAKYSSRNCSDDSDEPYEHGGIEISNTSQCAFKTANPVPDDEVIHADILCAEVPSSEDLINNPSKYKRVLDKYSAQIVQFALYMLYMSDEESQLSASKAQFHFSAFMNLDSRIVNDEIREFQEKQATRSSK